MQQQHRRCQDSRRAHACICPDCRVAHQGRQFMQLPSPVGLLRERIILFRNWSLKFWSVSTNVMNSSKQFSHNRHWRTTLLATHNLQGSYVFWIGPPLSMQCNSAQIPNIRNTTVKKYEIPLAEPNRDQPFFWILHVCLKWQSQVKESHWCTRKST